MREVIVPVGPRASGKSTFCRRAMELDSSIVLVSRDDLLVDIFDETSLDPYTGGQQHVLEVMWQITKEQLEGSSNIRMILDTWNGTPKDRANINKNLRDFGADRVEAWYFVTPVEFVAEWFWKKPDVAKTSEMKTRQGDGVTFYLEGSPRADHRLFHELALSIDSDGFDEVIRINPLMTRPEHILRLQTSLEI